MEFADCYYNPPVTAQWLVDSATLAIVMGTLGLFPIPGLDKDSTEITTASIMKQVAALLKDDNTKQSSRNSNDNESIDSIDSSGNTPSGLKMPLLVIDLNIREVFWPDISIEDMRCTIIDFVKGADIIKLTDMVS